MAKQDKERGKAFSAADMEILFQMLEERLPMGPDQSEHLTMEYNKRFTFQEMPSPSVLNLRCLEMPRNQ